ncbi:MULTISPECIES: D-alanyl-D-alanine carboxypeptidase/D-alanyl-D-alanine-endopeptidase [unclassified Arenibacter]|jgi:D-alanyl-D-alanine carboxypeptidase/D-alanyl-D-alanine-endopeptidase (penicillin-binding protein 4)|uniref:D-alanyl-D-alanine carboxypeptidase/D-alanyl-D-alanine-endopeptidase n=1 Tax=unclassified Arenibacter TaxID=2615047 RepID=UPI0020447179|nr:MULTISPECIES: D-alanyl-D-alanine carboxypeptidase [unclassified Arenibacter]
MNAHFQWFTSAKMRVLGHLIIISASVSLLGCKSFNYNRLNKNIDRYIHSRAANDYFQGLLIYDPIKNDTLYSYNSQKYFTPASNTKIFTLYSSLKTLPDKIPALKYIVKNDTLYMEGTGDPTLLHPYFGDSSAVKLAQNHKNISLYLNNFKDSRYGPGWAWEDYDLYFSPERNSIPLYGNVVTITNNGSLLVNPEHFKDQVVPIGYGVNREFYSNTFYFDPQRSDTLESPFIIDSTLTKSLLEKVLHKKVNIVQKMPNGQKQVLYSVSSDSLYKRMMEVSDNFLAEQLLIVSSSTLSDTLNGARARAHILDHYLTELEQPPRWVDGSGLSRYNLFTPGSMVYVLNKMYHEVPRERLFNFFPIGGLTGTLKGRFIGGGSPYIYAKTGSLGNNYCLSGYLLTRSGKTLIFSFMNNHFTKSNSEVIQYMEPIFTKIRDNY